MFFWMGDDLFHDETKKLLVPQWCPLAQLWVNNRDPETDSLFEQIKEGLFVKDTKFDFEEEYTAVPYIRDYPKEVKTYNSSKVKPTVHRDTFVEGKPNGKSIEDSLEMIKSLFYFAAETEHDDIYVQQPNQPGILPYQIFARANVHLARKYRHFGSVRDIIQLHDDLCDHLFENIPSGFFYRIAQGKQGEKWGEGMEGIVTNKYELQSFNDLMKRTLFLFKTAFGMDLGIVDGANRCMAIKTALLNMVVNGKRREIALEADRSYHPRESIFILKKVVTLAPVAIVWPSWTSTFDDKIYNWKVRPKIPWIS